VQENVKASAGTGGVEIGSTTLGLYGNYRIMYYQA